MLASMNSTPVAWRLILHHEVPETALDWSRANNRIAIGWGKIGHVRASGLTSAEAIRDAIKSTYGGRLTGANPGNGGKALHSLAYEMQPGGLVILRASTNRAVVRVTGDYLWSPLGETQPSPDYRHQRDVAFTDIDPDRLWQERDGLGEGSRYCVLLPLAS